MLRPSGPVTGNSNEVVNSGMSSFTGTSSGTSAFRVPPDGSTSVTGTSDIFDSFLIWHELTSAKPVCATRDISYLGCAGATRQDVGNISTILTGRPYITYELFDLNSEFLLRLQELDLRLFFN